MNKIVLLLVILVFFFILKQQNKFIEPEPYTVGINRPSPPVKTKSQIVRIYTKVGTGTKGIEHILEKGSYTKEYFINNNIDINSIINNTDFFIYYELDYPSGVVINQSNIRNFIKQDGIDNILNTNSITDNLITDNTILPINVIFPYSSITESINIEKNEIKVFSILTRDELNSLVNNKIKMLTDNKKQYEDLLMGTLINLEQQDELIKIHGESKCESKNESKIVRIFTKGGMDINSTEHILQKGRYPNKYFIDNNIDIRSIYNNTDFIILYELGPEHNVKIVLPRSNMVDIFDIKKEDIKEFNILTTDEFNTLVNKKIKMLNSYIKIYDDLWRTASSSKMPSLPIPSVPSYPIPSVPSYPIKILRQSIKIYTNGGINSTEHNLQKGSYTKEYFINNNIDIDTINNDSDFIILYEIVNMYIRNLHIINVIFPRSIKENVNIKKNDIIEFNIFTKDEFNSFVNGKINMLNDDIRKSQGSISSYFNNISLQNRLKQYKDVYDLVIGTKSILS